MVCFQTVEIIETYDETTIYVCCNWPNENLNITIFSGNDVYNGEFTKADMMEFCDLLCEEIESYISSVKEVLAHYNKEYSYKLEHTTDPDEYCFSWTKNCDGVFVLNGKISLVKNQNINKDNLILFLLNRNRELRAELINTEKAKEDVVFENQKLQNLVKEITNLKNTMEKELYEKFVLLLNEKKKRIKTLLEIHGDQK